MDFGYKLLLIGLIMSIAVFILPYEYPNIVAKEIERIGVIGSFVIIVIGVFFVIKSKSAQNICQNCGEKLDKNEKYCPNCGNRL